MKREWWRSSEECKRLHRLNRKMYAFADIALVRKEEPNDPEVASTPVCAGIDIECQRRVQGNESEIRAAGIQKVEARLVGGVGRSPNSRIQKRVHHAGRVACVVPKSDGVADLLRRDGQVVEIGERRTTSAGVPVDVAVLHRQMIDQMVEFCGVGLP